MATGWAGELHTSPRMSYYIKGTNRRGATQVQNTRARALTQQIKRARALLLESKSNACARINKCKENQQSTSGKEDQTESYYAILEQPKANVCTGNALQSTSIKMSQYNELQDT